MVFTLAGKAPVRYSRMPLLSCNSASTMLREPTAAEGWQKGLFVERETMRPRRLRSEERALFTPYVHSTGIDGKGKCVYSRWLNESGQWQQLWFATQAAWPLKNLQQVNLWRAWCSC